MGVVNFLFSFCFPFVFSFGNLFVIFFLLKMFIKIVLFCLIFITQLIASPCQPFDNCQDCVRNGFCHWCTSGCHAFASIYGCLTGLACSPTPEPTTSETPTHSPTSSSSPSNTISSSSSPGTTILSTSSPSSTSSPLSTSAVSSPSSDNTIIESNSESHSESITPSSSDIIVHIPSPSIVPSCVQYTTDNKKCSFPFEYDGKVYHECTKADYPFYWCSTWEGSHHYHFRYWGTCGECKNEIVESITMNQTKNSSFSVFDTVALVVITVISASLLIGISVAFIKKKPRENNTRNSGMTIFQDEE
eukprot:c15382_g1_i1.p1 GENE.c15382_g1_i1~~c15382_g1_i1.p1  ORF type:complete len:303 (+),score=48.86 c15382_g1_i1:1-909(+)